MKVIDKMALIDNLKSMINVLEFDSMRSPGKAKLNSQHLHSMYFLIDRYEGQIVKEVNPKIEKPKKVEEK